jgi:hypothetical protein
MVNAIRVRRQLESTTLTLPELAPLVGKQVEVIVLEEAETTRRIVRTLGLLGPERDLDSDALDGALRELEHERAASLEQLARKIVG